MSFDYSKNQIIRNITRAEYDAIDALNFSGLKLWNKCPMSWKYSYIDKIKVPPSEAMKRGTAVDALLLSGEDSEEFLACHTFKQKTDKKTGEVSETISVNADVKKAFLCSKEIRRSPLFPKEIDFENAQVCLYVNIGGLRLKGLIDYLEEDFICDLKSPSSIEKFAQTFDTWYLPQLGFYSFLYDEIMLRQLGGKLFVVDSANAQVQKARFWRISASTLKAYYPDANKLQEWLLIQQAIERGEFPLWKAEDWQPSVDADKCLDCKYFNHCPFAVQKEFYDL